MANTILWIYIVLLVVGGVMGFLKAKSKVSLVTSIVFAIALSLCAGGILGGRYTADVILALLVVVFVIRYVKTKKFMPAGFLVILTIVTLLVRFLAGGTP